MNFLDFILFIKAEENIRSFWKNGMTAFFPEQRSGTGVSRASALPLGYD